MLRCSPPTVSLFIMVGFVLLGSGPLSFSAGGPGLMCFSWWLHGRMVCSGVLGASSAACPVLWHLIGQGPCWRFGAVWQKMSGGWWILPVMFFPISSASPCCTGLHGVCLGSSWQARCLSPTFVPLELVCSSPSVAWSHRATRVVRWYPVCAGWCPS